MKEQIKFLKTILKADLTKSKTEINLIIFFMERDEKTVLLSNAEIAEKLEITHSNFLRTAKKLLKNNVLGQRTVKGKEYYFLRSMNVWGNTTIKNEK